MRKLIYFVWIMILGMLVLPVSAQNHLSKARPAELSIEKELHVFPNPCRGSRVTVQLRGDEMVTLRMLNLAGREVLHTHFSTSQQKAEVLLSDLPRGVYLIQVKTLEGKLLAAKLVKAED